MRKINRHYVSAMLRVACWNLTSRVCPGLNMRHGFHFGVRSGYIPNTAALYQYAEGVEGSW